MRTAVTNSNNFKNKCQFLSSQYAGQMQALQERWIGFIRLFLEACVSNKDVQKAFCENSRFNCCLPKTSICQRYLCKI